MKANINWEEFRERQRDAAAEAVRGALVLDEVARRERIAATEEDIDAEVAALRRAQRPDARRPCAPGSRRRAGSPACTPGIRREKTVDFLLSRATKIQA